MTEINWLKTFGLVVATNDTNITLFRIPLIIVTITSGLGFVLKANCMMVYISSMKKRLSEVTLQVSDHLE